jgi:large subunit ribosomal protein L23
MILEARDIIKRPLVTEKSVDGASIHKYTFEVDPRVNKIQIRKAIEEIFGVKVVKVNTLNVLGKKRGFGRVPGKMSDWKKAIVTLRKEDKIELDGIDYFEM